MSSYAQFSRFKSALIFVATLSISVAASAAQRSAYPAAQSGQSYQNQTAPYAPGQPSNGLVPSGGAMGGVMTSSGAAQSMAQVLARSAPGAAAGMGNPLQGISRLFSILDDARVRTLLGLTDQQTASLRKILVDTETFTITTGAQIAVNSIELRELLRADKPDHAAVTSKGDEISKATSDLIGHYLQAILAAKTILTPEQQDMIRSYMDNGLPALAAAPNRRR